MTSAALALLTSPARDSGATAAGATYRMVDPQGTHLQVLDLSATRGDGIFETFSTGAGRIQALEPHLARFARSAAMLDLPEPDLDAWRETIFAVSAAIPAVAEAYVKIVMTRGVEGSDDGPTGWVYAAPAPDFTAARRDGIRVITVDRGYRHDVASTSPWLLAGAKTLSYAVNKAVLREAVRRDADDAVFVSSDGYLLEGSTSNLILRRGDTLVTPSLDLGILAGTTQADVFRFAESIGFAVEYGLFEVGELAASDNAWLVSSMRHVAPIRSVDGTPHPVDAELTGRMNEFLISRTD